MKKIQETEEGYQEALKRNNMDVDDDEDERIPLTKDLTSIVEKLSKNKSSYMNSKDLQVALQEIPSTSVAVFQNIDNSHERESETMLNQVSTNLCCLPWYVQLKNRPPPLPPPIDVVNAY